MPRRPNFPLLIPTVLVLAGSAATQRREPVRGAVELEGGAPWPRARVTLLSRPVPGDERYGEADVVRATTDAKGSFWAKLFPARRYTAWAVEATEGGSFRISAPVDVRSSLNMLKPQS